MTWSKKILHDKFFQQAKKAGYVSRAAFKLKEIQKKHRVIKPGGRVLDLGCAPGAWLQVACQEIKGKKKGGLVLGIDIQECKIPSKFCDECVTVIQADARKLTPKSLEAYSPDGFDVVLSDMLHLTTGQAELDVGQSIDLASAALHLSVGYFHDLYGGEFRQTANEEKHQGVLKENGNLVMKIFEGSGCQEFVSDVRRYFSKIARVRPDATRKISREFYLIGLGRKPPKSAES